MQGVCDIRREEPAPGRAAPSGFADDRIDGWKSIAAYFGRDRTTVIRWARERALPVHRLPGGRVGTVYALRGELDRWAKLRVDGPTEAPPAPPSVELLPVAPVVVTVAARRWPRRWTIAGAMLLLLAAIALTLPGAGTGGATGATLPADRRVAARFLMARDLVAARSPATLPRGIVLLQDVTAAAPDFALGHAALAEGLLLSREFGQLGDAEAFDRARIAARHATRLAPDLPMARRTMGFLAYWADRDAAEADVQFRAALAADPDDALTRFWYGNILSDRGDHAAALAELDRARLAMPGSVALITDYGWALWSAGRDAEGMAILRWVARAHPDGPVAHDCLAIIALVQDDPPGYARHFIRFARLRANAPLQRDAAELDRALADDPGAIRRIVTDRAVRSLNDGTDPSPAVAMVVAARAGRWDAVAARLRIGEARGERWGESAILDRVVRLIPDVQGLGGRIARRRI